MDPVVSQLSLMLTDRNCAVDAPVRALPGCWFAFVQRVEGIRRTSELEAMFLISIPAFVILLAGVFALLGMRDIAAFTVSCAMARLVFVPFFSGVLSPDGNRATASMRTGFSVRENGLAWVLWTVWLDTNSLDRAAPTRVVRRLLRRVRERIACSLGIPHPGLTFRLLVPLLCARR